MYVQITIEAHVLDRIKQLLLKERNDKHSQATQDLDEIAALLQGKVGNGVMKVRYEPGEGPWSKEEDLDKQDLDFLENLSKEYEFYSDSRGLLAGCIQRLCDEVRRVREGQTGIEKILCDNMRHLVCLPYTVENLHKMAQMLGIKRCWYHSGARWPHYDIPKRRVTEIQADPRVEVVSSRELLRTIRV